MKNYSLRSYVKKWLFYGFYMKQGQTKKSHKSLICKTFIVSGLFCLSLLAEREGFEPPEPRSSTVFKTAAIDHSAISPIFLLMDISSKAMQMYVFFLFLQTILPIFTYVFHNKLCINIY